MYALSYYTRGTLGLVNLFCRTWSISSLNGVKFYAEGGKWECRHQNQAVLLINELDLLNFERSAQTFWQQIPETLAIEQESLLALLG